MEFKVRELNGIEEKSVQQVEQELLDKHEEKFSEEPKEVNEPIIDTSAEDIIEPQANELSEEDILSYIGKRYGKQINSLDEFAREREEAEALPEDVATYMKYKKETGRGIEDFAKLNRDLDNADPEKLLRDYLSATEKGLDAEDIDSMMDEYTYDEDLDDESYIKKVKLTKKKMVAKAKEYFESEKEKYRIPVESMGKSISDEEANALAEYKQYVEQSASLGEQMQKREQWFQEKTGEVFGNEFKGFEFNIGDNKLVYTPADATELKKSHSEPANFTKKFLDDNGLLVDPVGYHKALAVAMNPEKFASFFYEQGKAEAVDDVMRKTKNINMSDRNTPQNISKGETTVRVIDQDSGRGLKIRSRK